MVVRCIGFLGLALAICCGGGAGEAREPTPGPGPSPVLARAASGIGDSALAALLTEHWDWRLRTWPTWATTLGDHRFDDQLGDLSERASAEWWAQQRRWLARARALSSAELGAGDALTLAIFVDEVERDLATEPCRTQEWSVSAQHNLLGFINSLPDVHRLESIADGGTLVARYRRIGTYVDQSIATLERGLAAGLVGNAHSIELAADMVAKQLAQPMAEWPLMKVLERLPRSWPAVERDRIAAEIRAEVEGAVRDALTRYHGMLERLQARGRGPDQVGLLHLPNGDVCYRAQIHRYTGLPLTAEQLHELGKAEIAAIGEEMKDLGAELFGTSDLQRIIEQLRTQRSLYFDDAQSVVAKAEDAVAKARAALPRAVGRLPRTDVVVVPIPEYEAPYTTIAYYREPHADGSKPGEYFINTYRPEVRPRFEMEVLAYHEAIPGHHLQIALSQEQEELPAFRRYSGDTAFVEGWALYVERLADELGLYSGPLDRMGMLSYDAWRAARLVVDTGIHAKGWSRRQAEDYMLAHTALTRENVVNEVDRYITWPGQALAYKIGQCTIRELRARAEGALGTRFDLAGFHDAVLERGAVPLSVLRQQVDAWIAETGR